MRTADIRDAFISFFRENGHDVVPSSPLVPRNDPTLMFTNAGMVQFKNVFTGAETSDYTTAVSSQKCVRAGGKHNDLDYVGYTARHHTFFEMLGNFSFGDYFKEEAIGYAWRFLTTTLDLPEEKLIITVYHEDEEAASLWKKIAGLGDDRIIRIATSDNFWSMGDTGPCGPCSEIFYDHGPEIAGGPPGSPDEDGDRFIEIWNLVFMQYDQISQDERRGLPKPSIDTGMGLERISAILQGVHDNYDIDLFQSLISRSAAVSGAAPTGDALMSHRVIADHIRSTCFLMADGVLPSNEGRGYVLRRIMRRAMRHAHLLGSKDLLMHQLVPTLVEEMGAAFPELVRAQTLMTETLEREEVRFRGLLERGLKILDEESAGLSSGEVLPGAAAFKLYDTYGFPFDLTEESLRARGITVDATAFHAAMEAQKAEARAAWSGSGDSATDAMILSLRQNHPATDFLGYDTDEAMGQVIALANDDGETRSASAGTDIIIVTNQSPFYGESGGQQGDTGAIFWEGGHAVVNDTQKADGLILHKASIEDGALSVNHVVTLRPDIMRRSKLRANHSATHLLHEALRRRLGDHVMQKGSLVAEDRLRFDFSHADPMTVDQLKLIEADVNQMIRQNEPVVTRVMEPDRAIEMGAMAFFGEKYGDEVRVLFMGKAEDGRSGYYSVELCGGTHVTRLGDIALFKITSESAVSSGIRRIEAVTGEAARLAYQTREDQLLEAASTLKTAPHDLVERIAALQSERKTLEKQLSEAKRALAMGGSTSEPQAADMYGDIAFFGQVLQDVPAKDLRGIADEAKKRLGSGVTLILSVNEGKAAIVAGVTDDLTDQISAVELVRLASQQVGGKGGGGRPDMAQAGGPDGAAAQQALSAIKAYLAAQADAA
ncbi:MAG: alanine--tRNA ligase [Sphingomonadales bacterium]